MISVRLY